jgi:chromosome segregation ATPase
MNISTEKSSFLTRCGMVVLGFGLVMACTSAQVSDETAERTRIAATNMEDAIVVDCQLPGKLRKLGGTRTYLTPGRLVRTPAIVCRTRGGEYTLGDLASGTLSLQRWLVPAEKGDAEAQYYVARIHANGMDNVTINYAEAARWYEKAADQGFSEARQELGYLYERGFGVAKDPLKALNLQRAASGLGEELDYAYKIADAQALADRLATQLQAANGALRDSQLALSSTQDQLFAARAGVRQQELRMVGLIASLEEARRLAANAASPQVDQLEQEIRTVTARLEQSQAAILRLERERDSAGVALAAQLAGGQATQLELRELLARTERTEREAESLGAQLAEAHQRLIQSDEEVRELQTAYREQTDRLAADRERLLEARSQADSDAAAYLVARETEIASRTARIASLELQIGSMQAQLDRPQNTEVEDALREEVAVLQARYANDVAALRNDRDRLTQSHSASKEQLGALYAESKQRLSEKDTELNSRKREIDTFAAESARLRARVEQLETQQLQQAIQSGLSTAQLQARLSISRQHVITLRNSLDAVKAEKSSLEAKLLEDRIALQDQMTSDNASSAQEIELLRAEIAAAESTIDLQTLRIAALEKQTADGGLQLSALRNELGEPEDVLADLQLASAVLDMARSTEEAMLGRFHALLIANENYRNMQDLTTPIRDVDDIEKLLTNRYGFSVKILHNATDDQIMRTLHEYANTLTEEDNLLIYYAGRGSTPDGPPDRAYWLGVDADPELRNTWLLAEHVSDKIKDMQAKRILLVTDSCFSRRRVQSATMTVGRGLDPEKFKLLTQFQSRYVLTSGANIPVYDESGDRTHSLFAKLFLEILRQNKNVLSGEMLSHEMVNRVRERIESPERVTPSYSFLQDAGHTAGDFFFVPMPQPLLVMSDSIGQDSV